MSLLIWYKEYHNEKKKQLMIMIVLIAIILSFANIGNLAKYKAEFKIDKSGYQEVVKVINDNYNNEFRNTFIIFSYCIPMIIFFFYLGFPHLIVLYKNEKESKNLYHLLTTPLGPKQMILGYTTYCLLRTYIPTILIFIINILVTKIFGVVHVFNGKLFLFTTIVMISMIFCVLYFICGILWITDGNKIIFAISRVTLLLGMSSCYLILGKNIDLNWLIDWKVFVVIISIVIGLYFVTRKIIQYVNVEKLLSK